MRLFAIATLAGLCLACGGEQPPAVPASTTPAAPSSPPSQIPAPSVADLHGVPLSDDEDLQELYDVSRDVLAVARSESGAVTDLATDLSRFEPSGGSAPDAKALAESVGRALQGRSLDEATARRVAVLLYVARHAGRLTPEQRSAASAQLRDLLSSTGAPAAEANAAAGLIR